MSTCTLRNPVTNSTLQVPAEDRDLIDLLILQGYGISPVIDLQREIRGDSDSSYLEDDSRSLNNSSDKLNSSLIYSKNESNSTDTEEQTVKHTKENILSILQDPRMVDEAIRIIGDNQTADELSTKTVCHDNGIGFSHCYSKTGTHLWVCVTGKDPKNGQVRWEPKSLTHPRATKMNAQRCANHGLSTAVGLGHKIAIHHWRQLSALLNPGYQVTEIATQEKPKKVESKVKVTPMVLIEGIVVGNLSGSGKAYRCVYKSRVVWLPKSQIKIVGDDVAMPAWLADKNELMEDWK